MKKTSYLLMITCIFASLSLRATLTWEKELINFNPTPDETELSGAFPFVNNSDTTVTISNVKTSCGCTAGKLEKKIYAPGESGEISVSYSVGHKVGRQSTSVTVTSDDKVSPEKQLKLKINIPELLEVRPRYLMWRPNEEMMTKTVNLKVLEGYDIKVVSAKASVPGYKVELVDWLGGSLLKVTPEEAKTSDKRLPPGSSYILITTDYPKDKPKTFKVHLRR